MSFFTQAVTRGCRWASGIRKPLGLCPRTSRSFITIPDKVDLYSPVYNQRMCSFRAYTNEEGSTMHKTKRIGLTLLLGLLLGVGSYAYASDETSSKALEQLHPVTSSTVKDTDWVRLCLNQYPEILWLADENVRKTEEGKASLHVTV